MKTLTCTKKIKTKKNIVKKYILVDNSTKEELELARKDVVQLLRDRENYTITNLQLTFNNRVTHLGPLNTKAKSEVEEDN